MTEKTSKYAHKIVHDAHIYVHSMTGFPKFTEYGIEVTKDLRIVIRRENENDKRTCNENQKYKAFYRRACK